MLSVLGVLCVFLSLATPTGLTGNPREGIRTHQLNACHARRDPTKRPARMRAPPNPRARNQPTELELWGIPYGMRQRFGLPGENALLTGSTLVLSVQQNRFVATAIDRRSRNNLTVETGEVERARQCRIKRVAET